jgi:hypothetical protein
MFYSNKGFYLGLDSHKYNIEEFPISKRSSFEELKQ